MPIHVSIAHPFAINRSRAWLCAATITVCMGYLSSPPAQAQSEALRRHSESSLMASVEVPVAIAGALSAGGEFVVTSVAASGTAVAVTVSAAAVGASFVVYLSAEAVKGLALVSGYALQTVAVSGGWLLMAAGEVLCFIANDAARPHVHSRELVL